MNDSGTRCRVGRAAGCGIGVLLCSFVGTAAGEEIVVSASRSAERAFDAPGAINAIGAEEIRNAGPRIDISESLLRVPGIFALDRQNYAQDVQLSIRGFGARSAFGVRGIRILVDGIPATMPDGQGQVSAIDLDGAERIEVLRGPLAQLYGNAAGGVVQVETGIGGPDTLTASADAARYGTRRYGLRLRGEHGAMQGAASYSAFSTDGWRDHSEARRNLFNARLRFAVSPALRITLSGNAFDQPNADDPQGLTRAEMDAHPRSAAALAIAQDARKRVRQDQLGMTAEYTLDRHRTLTGRLYGGQRDLFQALAIPLAAQASETSSGGIVALDRDYGGLALQYRQLEFMHETLTFTAGIEADGMREHRRGYVNDGGARGALKRDEQNAVWNTDLYAQLSWQPYARWTALAGVRRSVVRFRVDDDYIVGANPDDSGNVRYEATSPVLGLTFHATDALNLYANWGRGFETPSFTELAYRSDGPGLNLALDPARSRHAEAGVKFRPGADQRIDLALFHIDTRDELVVDSSNGGRTTYRNASRTSRRGLELLYEGAWTESLGARVAYTVLDARFRADADSADAALDGRRLPGTPDRQLYAALQWHPRWAGPFSGFGVLAEAIHVGGIPVDDENTDAAGSHTHFNLRTELKKRVGTATLTSYARLDNLSGERYAGSVIVNQAAGRYFEPAPERTWSIGVIAELAL